MGGDSMQEGAVSRRAVLRLGCGLVAAGLLATSAEAAKPRRVAERVLSFEHLHTGEKLRRTYWAEGRYIRSSLREIHHLLRDFRTGETRPIDLKLLELLHDLHGLVGSRKPIEIVSAYRSKRTNGSLASHDDGVARRSFHLRGMAVDLRLPDRDLGRVRQAALRLARGGVGYYPTSDFVHIDVGPHRSW
ncbi:MAG: DUF882 domain-containing protein [Alphaproteobacteria bacterium]